VCKKHAKIQKKVGKIKKRGEKNVFRQKEAFLQRKAKKDLPISEIMLNFAGFFV